MKRTNINQPGLFLASGLFVAMLYLSSASASPVSTNTPPEGWLGDAAGSDVQSHVSFEPVEGGGIRIIFKAESGIPTYTIGTIVADAGASSSPFYGDYQGAGVKAVMFRISGDGHTPLCPMVMLIGQSGRRWYNLNVTASSVAGEWVQNRVEFSLDQWVTDSPGDTSIMWNEDVSRVAMLGMRLCQSGRSAESYTVDQFRLMGELGPLSNPADLSPLECELKSRFGVTSADLLTDQQKALDTDGDGMTDLHEIMSENDPAFANSIFAAQIAGVDGDAITIKWAAVAGLKYMVFRSEDLVSGFHGLTAELFATNTGYMTYTDFTANGSGPYFYRILRR